MANEESPVKLFHSEEKKLKIQSSYCLICGKQSKKNAMRKPQEKGLKSFVEALIVRKHCNGFGLKDYQNFIDFESKSWSNDGSDVRWHPNCYASFIIKQNLKSFLPNDVVDDTDSQPSTSTRSCGELPDLSSTCFFCGQKKRQTETRLVLIQYENVLQNLKKRCNEKNDLILKRKIGGDFDRLPVLDAKYHPTCFKLYMKETTQKAQGFNDFYDSCFEEFIEQFTPLLQAGRAVLLVDLLFMYKEILKDNGYE